MAKLVFYTYPSCTSCRKTKGWLTRHEIRYEERHLFRDHPNTSELMEILKLSKSGVEELLAKRSREFKKLSIDIESLPLSSALKLLADEPKLLKRPILTDGKNLVVGYHHDQLARIAASEEHQQTIRLASEEEKEQMRA
ncbi:Spx/MgsR family RNA polymerase-binding regulatory protein [Sporolactobacillus spathodeae]|uniref:Spx/MgsR family transcriptional regulator n=1 Tax=Sporolactobacillus spathodeae TaxID=1465502 RepID=A0ABS2Q6K8_9BACL|nr:Spx/MgsR family RNA polymerase-binding regulatory protein [Sporolactobacillus spathodeae]MBM7657286.1 Spx/MgsR family transcriptional regulator [Sporolactobacillus spathodeae]